LAAVNIFIAEDTAQRAASTLRIRGDRKKKSRRIGMRREVVINSSLDEPPTEHRPAEMILSVDRDTAVERPVDDRFNRVCKPVRVNELVKRVS